MTRVIGQKSWNSFFTKFSTGKAAYVLSSLDSAMVEASCTDCPFSSYGGQQVAIH